MNLNIMACSFQRRKDGKWEKGIIINEEGMIIDKKGNSVGPVWNYNTKPFEFCINLDLKDGNPKLKSPKKAFRITNL